MDDLAQDRDQWRTLVNTVMNLQVPYRESLSSFRTGGFSRGLSSMELFIPLFHSLPRRQCNDQQNCALGVLREILNSVNSGSKVRIFNGSYCKACSWTRFCEPILSTSYHRNNFP
jgi:hypothetical protein